MQVILLRDVAKIGRRYEIVKVPDGFALNKLIPKGDAEIATPQNVKKVTQMRKRDTSDKENSLLMIKKIVEDLNGEPLKVPMQANEKGHLFKAVSEADIIEAAAQKGVSIPKSLMIIESPIKGIGVTSVNLKNQGQSFTLPIEVVAK